MTETLKIVDSHIHLYDHQVNTHTFLNEFDPNYAAFVGDYTDLPKKYLLDDYLQDSKDYQVEGIIWHEFLSTNPAKEVKWIQKITQQAKIKLALVALVDFLDPKLEEILELYSTAK